MNLAILTGAKKNFGDFLIEARLVALLNQKFPNSKVHVIPRWESANREHFEVLRSCAAVFCGGGPYIRNDLFETFPILKAKHSEGLNLRFVAGGWKAGGGSTHALSGYALKKSVREALNRFSDRAPISVRDNLTYLALKRNAVSTVEMTGCTVWYDIASLGKPLRKPSEIRNIVFSTPEGSRLFDQSAELVRLCAERFPRAKIRASFNRGIDPDANTSAREAAHLFRLRNKLESYGVECLDTAYIKDSPSWYDEADFHFGYRLHTHLSFVSKRQPSYLLNEDGRGAAAAATLSLYNFNAYDVMDCSDLTWARKLPAKLVRRWHQSWKAADNDLPRYVTDLMEYDAERDFVSMRHVPEFLDLHYEKMSKFLDDCVRN
jgi:hypothetical protein